MRRIFDNAKAYNEKLKDVPGSIYVLAVGAGNLFEEEWTKLVLKELQKLKHAGELANTVNVRSCERFIPLHFRAVATRALSGRSLSALRPPPSSRARSLVLSLVPSLSLSLSLLKADEPSDMTINMSDCTLSPRRRIAVASLTPPRAPPTLPLPRAVQ